jgi:hypothetical protein
MLVVLEADSVRLSESSLSRSVFARIYLKCGDDCFPEAGWDDFAEVVLGWWIDGAIALMLYGQRANFRFMDGDFSFNVGKRADGNFTVSLKERAQVVGSSAIDVAQFSRSLVAAANTLARRLQEILGDRSAASELVAKKNHLQHILNS